MAKIALYGAGAAALLLVLYALVWIIVGGAALGALTWTAWRAGLLVGHVRARRELRLMRQG